MPNPQITKIPLPPGIGRVGTGALPFGNHWPGLYLRGIDVIVLMAGIRFLAERLGNQTDPGIWKPMLDLKELADLIERDVKVHRPAVK